jgi:formyl-CoA transferase
VWWQNAGSIKGQEEAMGGALDGIRILDLTQVQAGPSCTQLLAWLGAEVIKIEEPGVGDRTRKELAHDEDMDSFYYLVFNANKKSVCLNLKSEDGLHKFKELARTADVVVENFGPGGMDRFGLGYEQVKALNSGIVYVSIKGFGTYSPYAGHKAFESIAQAMSGAMSTNGESGGQPLIISAGVADSGSGLHCAIGILAALRQRDKTGVGDYVEVSMQDAAVNLMRIRMIETLSTREPQPREGNRWWDFPPLVYQCHPGGPDDYVVVYIGGEAWDSLLAIMGRPETTGDERYSTREARWEHAEEVEAMVSEWTSRRTKREVMEALNEIGVPGGAVLSTADVLEDPHLRAREMVIDVDDPNRGKYLALGCPIKLRSNTVTFAPPPLLGEHSEEVLSTLPT